MTRILIADDHEVVRYGLRRNLESQPKWEVVGEASDGKEAVAKALELKPDIAVLDYALPLVNGVEATRQIRARLPRTEVLIFTMHDSETVIRDLLAAGARGFLLKSDASRFLLAAIESLALHKPFFTDKVSEALLDSFLKRPGQHPFRAHSSRAGCRSADRGRAYQQADCQRAQHQPQDGGDAPRNRDAKAQYVVGGIARALRHPQRNRGGLEGPEAVPRRPRWEGLRLRS